MRILCILSKQQTINTIITKILKTNFVFVKMKKINSFAQQQLKREEEEGGRKIWKEEERW